MYANAHSKGQNAHLVHLVEQGNNEHRRILTRFQSVDSDVRAWIADLARGGDNLPPRTMYTSLDPYRSDGEEDDNDQNYISDSTTSARLYKSDVVPATYRFITELLMTSPAGDKASISVEEQTEEDEETTYRFSLTFPATTRLPVVVGPFSRSKWQARREACYQACSELVRVGLMNTRHFPQSSTLALPDVQTANTSARTHGYPRKPPDFWSNSPSGPATTLYPTIIAPDSLDDEAYAPVLLLTKAPLPLTLDVNVYYCGARATVHFYKAEPLEVTEAQLKALHGYTIRVMKSLMNKPFDCPDGSLLLYFAPLDSMWHSTLSARWPLLSLAKHIPWDAVQLAADYFSIPLVDGNASIDDRARDAILLDRQVEYTMRYFVVKVRHDMTPLSKAVDSPVRQSRRLCMRKGVADMSCSVKPTIQALWSTARRA